MGFRFRKRIKIAPGVHVNLTEKGISSTSIGGKGLTVNVGGKKGAKVTASIPGTGLSYTESLDATPPATGSPAPGVQRPGLSPAAILILVICALVLAALFVL